MFNNSINYAANVWNFSCALRKPTQLKNPKTLDIETSLVGSCKRIPKVFCSYTNSQVHGTANWRNQILLVKIVSEYLHTCERCHLGFYYFFIFLICLSEDVNPYNKNKPPTQRVIRHTPRAHFSAIGQKISFYHSSGSKVCANLFNFSIVDDATVTDKEK